MAKNVIVMSVEFYDNNFKSESLVFGKKEQREHPHLLKPWNKSNQNTQICYVALGHILAFRNLNHTTI